MSEKWMVAAFETQALPDSLVRLTLQLVPNLEAYDSKQFVPATYLLHKDAAYALSGSLLEAATDSNNRAWTNSADPQKPQ